ncbi:DNA-deoxyinosine glycosylase [Treponema sp. C6A8]|uniref:DNA-deoxyinosine glycosylase n=1 Tax=Treponema sp. C6A8 TaxID=1410609 RepID=UPI0004841169|nr:DNA-deoxyinosine glycosylase [Treponema sp. C6A8]
MPDSTLITHPLAPVWNEESKVLLLGTMPSPKSRQLGFFYMHPQNRFWRVLSQVFSENLALPNNAADTQAAIRERRDFLLRHKLALWDVLASCQIEGASDSSIRREIPNDFSKILSESKISRVFFTGQKAASLWKKHCAALYEERFHLQVHTLPSTSPANARFTIDDLIEEYQIVHESTLS